MAELDKICGELGKCQSFHNNEALECYYSVCVVIIGFINQRGLVGKIALKIGLNGLFQPQLCGSWGKAAEYLKQLSEILFDLQKDDESRLSDNIVRFLKEYIDGHITEDVSLVKLSEVSGYNASYLSRFFREYAGETLNDYISRKKLEKIGELICNASLNIGDIAMQAGFNSRTYFNRFVKKMTGLSPQEYRERCQHG